MGYDRFSNERNSDLFSFGAIASYQSFLEHESLRFVSVTPKLCNDFDVKGPCIANISTENVLIGSALRTTWLVTAVAISLRVLSGPEDFKCTLKLTSKQKIQRKFGNLEAHL